MRTAAVQLTIRDNLIDYIGTFSVSIGTCLFRHTKNTFLLPTTDSFSLYTSRICNLQLSNTKFRLRGYVVKDLSQLMIQSNQPIDYLINPSHVTSNGTCSVNFRLNLSSHRQHASELCSGFFSSTTTIIAFLRLQWFPEVYLLSCVSCLFDKTSASALKSSVKRSGPKRAK